MTLPLLLAAAIVAHEPGYTTSLAKHLQRWLKSEEISCNVTTPSEMKTALKNEKLAFLVGFNEPTAAELRDIREFRARGGKLVVFHSASPQLAEMMGVKPLGYAKAPSPGRWSRIDFPGNRFPGCPASILQTSSVLQRAAPIKGRSRAIGVWADRAGRPTGDAAFLRSGSGWWMTHVLLADGDEKLKARLCAAMVGEVEPSKWNARAAEKRDEVAKMKLRSYALRQTPRKGEIRAVWEHSGCGLHPGDWAKTIRELREARITDLFVNVAGAGFAHYPSKTLPRSKTFDEEGDQLAACLKAAKGSGIRVHAWVLCFTGTRSTPHRMSEFQRMGWRLKDKDGKLTDYLDPSQPALRAKLISTIDELQAMYPSLDGIHLDFVRWYERAQKPANAAQVITAFVTEARRHVKKPRWFTTAVLGKYPSCVASVGQDWESWIDGGLVDYAVPMNYTESREMYSSLVKQQGAKKTAARRTISGIGVTANESRLDAKGVIDQIRHARANGLAGVALFDLDTTLIKDVVPYLKLGIW